MKILFLGDINDVHLKRWALFFSKEHEIHIASFNLCNDEFFKKSIKEHTLFKQNAVIFSYIINSLNLGSLVFNPFSVIKQLKQLINEIKPDIIHGHSIIHHTILGSFTNFHPFIITAWGSDVFIYPKKSLLVKLLVKYALKKADLITCDGENVKNEIIKMNLPPEKIEILFHGTDVDKFAPLNEKHKQDRNNIKQKYGLSDAPTIISTRKLSPVYDIETLIRSIPLVIEKINNVQVIIIGWGPQKDYLINLSKELHVFNNIKFIGLIPNKEITHFLTLSDIYVSTALSDGGLAASTAEAMSCGLPVVITDFGDNYKWVEQTESGYLFHPHEYKKLAEILVELFNDPFLRAKMGENGRRKIVNDLNYYKVMGKMDKIYKSVVDKYRK